MVEIRPANGRSFSPMAEIIKKQKWIFVNYDLYRTRFEMFNIRKSNRLIQFIAIE